MSVVSINCGNFSSLDNFYQSVGLSSKEVGEITKNDQVELDCSLLDRNINIRISVLTTLLSVAYHYKTITDKPCKIKIGEDLSLLQFFKDTNLYLLSKAEGIIDWSQYEPDPKENIPLIILTRDINARLISFEPFIKVINNYHEGDITNLKNKIHGDIKTTLLREFNFIIHPSLNPSDRGLVHNLLTAITEYVINALVHGRSSAYVGLQISNIGISVCISDAGMGILESLKNNYNALWVREVGISSHIDAILNASLKRHFDVGLRYCISTIVQKSGFTVISSGDAEIIWGFETWETALKRFDHSEYQKELQSFNNILGRALPAFYTIEDCREIGGYKLFKYPLPGTRVFFEIPLFKD